MLTLEKWRRGLDEWGRELVDVVQVMRAYQLRWKYYHHIGSATVFSCAYLLKGWSHEI